MKNALPLVGHLAVRPSRKPMRRMLAAGAATACLALGGAATASANATPHRLPAVAITDLGAVDGTSVSFAGCAAVVHAGSSNAGIYARAAFTSLGTSTRGKTCEGWLQRRTLNTKTGVWSDWFDISDYHSAPDTSTGWYWDDADYQARTCVGDFLVYNSYSCGGAF